MSFSDISYRTNGQKILYSWFDALKVAGMIIESWLGSGFVSETSFTIANNQSSAANVTGLLLDSATVGSAFIDYDVYRKTTSSGATELKEVGTYLATYKSVAATWTLTPVGMGGEDSGVVLSITSAGQVKYTSTNITGTADTSRMKYKVRTFGA